MLQRGGVYPTVTARQVVSLFARYYDDPEDPAELLELLDLERVARTPVEAAVRRRAAARLARARTRRASRRRLLGRADRRGRSRGTRRDKAGGRITARPGRRGAAHDPRAGRSRTRRGPGDHPGCGAERRRGDSRTARAIRRRARNPFRRARRDRARHRSPTALGVAADTVTEPEPGSLPGSGGGEPCTRGGSHRVARGPRHHGTQPAHGWRRSRRRLHVARREVPRAPRMIRDRCTR